MFNWLFNQINGISDWLALAQPTSQLVFVAVLTSFFTACVTEPVRQAIAERRRRTHWRRFIYQELASIYAAILWQMDWAIASARISSPNEEQRAIAAIDAALRESLCDPFRTPRFNTAKDQPAFYELPEATTVERLYNLVNQTYSDQRRLAQLGEFYQIRDIIFHFRRCLFPEEIDWDWGRNAFRVPLDRPLNAILFYRHLCRQDLKKERWVLQSLDEISGAPPNDHRDGDGIFSKGEMLLYPAWARAMFRAAMQSGKTARSLVDRLQPQVASDRIQAP